MLEVLSFKITSDHLLLWVFLSLLWGVADSSTSAPDTTLTTTEAGTTTPLTTPLTTILTTKLPPENVKTVTVVTQNETSITLEWDKVNNISTYLLQYDNNGLKEESISGFPEGPSVTHVVSSLTAGTKYSFTLITTSDGLNSTGHTFSAPTAPRNTEEFKVVGQNETSITLQWKKVDNILNYILLFNGDEKSVTASEEQDQVTYTIVGLTSGTKYDFTLFTLFENVKSSGVNLMAVTAPENVKTVTVVTQNETSITLMWDKVKNISTYLLQYDNGLKEENISGFPEGPSVTHVVSSLTAGTKYSFTLITNSDGLNSTGHTFSAPTAPRNTEEFKVVGQNETSITLQWKKVVDFNYTLSFSGGEINITASEGQEQVTYTIVGLTSGTKYDFTLFTLFENVKSSGVNLMAVTAPLNTEEFKSVGQNETSITLQWKKVVDFNYTLSFSGDEINITASEGQEQVTYTIVGLTSGTKYDFILFTLFENVKSSGVNLMAVTAPLNTEEFRSVGQNETSITLQWKKVVDFNYTLSFSGDEINITASEGQEQVTYTIVGLTSGTKYNFTLFTLFENVKSSGENLMAVTAPENVKTVTVVTQNETSITLMWDKVKNISTYLLQYDNNASSIKGKRILDAFYQEASFKHEVSLLTAGTKYHFTLITVFEGVNSTGFSFNAVTVPSMVASVNVTERSVSTITLNWIVDEDKDWSYFLQINGQDLLLQPDRSTNVVSHSSTSLLPGTMYRFRVISMFSELNSSAYEDFTVTKISCTSANWHVTNSSIQGMIEGLFSSATATNTSQILVSPGGSNVSFSGLYPGATYEVSLEYENNSKIFPQCSHNMTVLPPNLSGHCEYWAAGYSVSIVWYKADGVWTEVEVNVNGRTHRVDQGQQNIYISGFLPAKTYLVSLASLSGTVRSSEEFVFLCSTDPRGVIAGSVFAVLLFALLVCLAVFIFLKRPGIISRKKPFTRGSKPSNKKCEDISVAKFPNHFHQLSTDENRGFSQEYEILVPVGTEQTRKQAILPENKPRNRFNNVLPYDWCRVKLTTSNPNDTSDYINASYMPGYNSNREYIATQGPLPSTVSDFWRMIWEQKVKGIVMVTNCTEGGRTKCERYWPADSQPCLYGELLVTMRSEQQELNWTLREFRVKHKNNSEERTVKHFHFTAWPDHGVPEGTEVLIQFRELVRQHIQRDGAGAPTVVHCSAGVGRTGTIIALDVLLQQLQKERAVGINAFVHKMRLSRPYMVQTESQYVFLHQCIMDCLQPNEGTDENIYENADMIYANATALQQFHTNA